jgi:hypothetical protein
MVRDQAAPALLEVISNFRQIFIKIEKNIYCPFGKIRQYAIFYAGNYFDFR